MKVKEILKNLKEARQAATLEHSEFYCFDKNSVRKNAELRKLTKSYRESWILRPIDEAIRLIEEAKR